MTVVASASPVCEGGVSEPVVCRPVAGPIYAVWDRSCDSQADRSRTEHQHDQHDQPGDTGGLGVSVSQEQRQPPTHRASGVGIPVRKGGEDVNEGFCGFDPPDGWLDLVMEIDARLAAGNPDYRIAQVKEKFGGLRFYTCGLTSDERLYVQEMETRSFGICQNCGTHANVGSVDAGWVATLCDVCAVARPSRDGGDNRGYGIRGWGVPASETPADTGS